MKNNSSFFYSILFFFIASIVSLIVSFIWIYLGDHWEALGDGIHYMNLYNGQVAVSPFGYRILTPYLASLLPWEAITNFTVVTLASLSITTGIVLVYMNKLADSKLNSIFVFIFWTTSFPFIYYGTTFVRADAPIFVLIALIVLLSLYRTSSFILLILLAVGTLFHEMVMIVIPLLWLDKIFSGSLTGSSKYSYYQLLLITVVTLSFYIFTRAMIPTNPSMALSYLTAPIEMFEYILNNSGGFIKHILRAYASFGPAFLFSFVYVFFMQNKLSDRVVYIGLLTIVFAATFLAIDTLRVMSIFYFPIIIYASYFITTIWNKGHHIISIIFLLLQITYTSIVYLNLRTFESSLQWNIIAALISLATLLLCFFEIKKMETNN